MRKDGFLITVSMNSARKIYTQQFQRLKELDRQITANSISLGKQLIVRDDPALREEYRIKNQVLISQKQALLKEAGYSSDYLEPIYYCKKCKDTGYIGQEQCSCFHQAMIDHLYSGSNMAKILARGEFSDLPGRLLFRPDDQARSSKP